MHVCVSICLLCCLREGGSLARAAEHAWARISTLAKNAMMKHYNSFNNDLDFREKVISSSTKKVGFSETRVKSYFENEVSNLLKDDSIKGLRKFLDLVCKVDEPTWIN